VPRRSVGWLVCTAALPGTEISALTAASTCYKCTLYLSHLTLAILQSHVFGNPHSQNPSSSLTGDRVEAVRDRILNFFNADAGEYQVIFTVGATGGLKIVGETFPWVEGSVFRRALPPLFASRLSR
jgi:hypothetical protein